MRPPCEIHPVHWSSAEISLGASAAGAGTSSAPATGASRPFVEILTKASAPLVWEKALAVMKQIAKKRTNGQIGFKRHLMLLNIYIICCMPDV